MILLCPIFDVLRLMIISALTYTGYIDDDDVTCRDSRPSQILTFDEEVEKLLSHR
jgi:hypothetical protein